MTGRVGGWLLDHYAPRRRRRLQEVWRRADEVQAQTLLGLVARARETSLGRNHDFGSIHSIHDYQSRVPVREYLDFRPLWTLALDGAEDLTWPGRSRYWVKTSGTTAGDKVIPVTPEAFASHRRGGWDALLVAAERAGGTRLLGGSMLFLGGGLRLAPIGQGCLVGDLSGLVVRRLPPGIRGRYSPGRTIGSIADWEDRITAVAALAARQDVRLLAGMPSWMLIFLQRVRETGEALGRSWRDLGGCWPNLSVLIHGGVSFAPYRAAFETAIGRSIAYVEVYAASEGFIALQTEPTGGLTLMLDHGIFYEFAPTEELGLPHPRRHTVADVELGRSYAIVLTTPAGLWSYVLGDTIRFTARDPLRLEITGRTRHFVNAFGENVIVEEVERALLAACRRTGAEVVEFTVAPYYPESGEPRGGHEWLIEFRTVPLDRPRFVLALDEALMGINTDYRIKRTGSVGMLPPRISELPPGAFYRWMREAGKLGDQHKVPRVTNNRDVAHQLLRTAEAPVGQLLPV